MESENKILIERLETKFDNMNRKFDRLNDALLGDDLNVREGFIDATNRRVTELESKMMLVDKIEMLERELKEVKTDLKDEREIRNKLVLKVLGLAGVGGGGVAAIASVFI